MKRVKIIFIFLALSFIVQASIFSLLNWKADHFLNPYYRLNHAYTVGLQLLNPHDFSLSYNNKFLAFIDEDQLKIIDLTKNKIVLFQEDSPYLTSHILGYKWLPDRNNLLYVAEDEKQQSQGLFSLDLEDLMLTESERVISKKERKLDLDIQEISQIELSTYTNNIFILFNNHFKEELQKIDIMKNLNRIDDPDEEIQKICVSNKFGTLYFESRQGNKTAIESLKDRDREIIIKGENIKLLGCQNNKVYWGNIIDGVLRDIVLYEKEQNMISSSQELTLWQGKIPIANSDVYITTDHRILIKSSHLLQSIQPDGKLVQRRLPNTPVVLSSTGKIYMEIDVRKDKLTYYWRSL